MSTSQALDAYLRGHGFSPAPGHDTWLDRAAAGGTTIRVVCPPEEETQLIALAPRSVCLYKSMFYAGTSDAVIIAAVQAALNLTQRESSARSGPARQPRDRQQGRPAARRRGRGERP